MPHWWRHFYVAVPFHKKQTTTHLGHSVRALVHRNVHGMPKLTIKNPGPAGLARLRSVYHNKFVFTNGFISIALTTVIFNSTGLSINNCLLKHIT